MEDGQKRTEQSWWPFFAVKIDGSDVIPEICLIYKHAISLRISVYFHRIVPIRFRIKRDIFSMSITVCFHNDVTGMIRL